MPAAMLSAPIVTCQVIPFPEGTEAPRASSDAAAFAVLPGSEQEEPAMHAALTLAELRELPAAVDLITAARAFGLGRTLAYTLARTGSFPVPVHRHGNLYRVYTSDILKVLEPKPDNDIQPPAV